MTAPEFDGEAAATANKRALAKTETAAEDAVDDWQKQVLNYWAAYTKFTTGVEAHRTYTTEVEMVNAAWTIIAGKWADYSAAVTARDAAVAARAAFITEQKTAQVTYDQELADCEATPAAGTTEDPEPCDAQVPRPRILDQVAPLVPAPPAPPADPRPDV